MALQKAVRKKSSSSGFPQAVGRNDSKQAISGVVEQSTPPTLALLAGAKLIRAHDGCLGAERRRRTWLVCDKPWGADKWALIQGFPNRETGR